MVSRRFGLVAFGLIASSVGCGKSNQCTSHADCYNSQVAEDLGRCAPIEVYCSNRTCRATCGQICTTANSAVNACSDPELLCNDATTPAEINFCTALPIACTSVDDCPLYRPPDAQGIQHDWTCERGLCRYPGFRYKWEAGADAGA